jgi:hypothetical protein
MRAIDVVIGVGWIVFWAFHDASATLHEVAHVQGHLAAQDELLTRIAAKIGLDPVPVIDNPALDETTDPDPGR